MITIEVQDSTQAVKAVLVAATQVPRVGETLQLPGELLGCVIDEVIWCAKPGTGLHLTKVIVRTR